jgi:hypothetical protein
MKQVRSSVTSAPSHGSRSIIPALPTFLPEITRFTISTAEPADRRLRRQSRERTKRNGYPTR